jgi:hypothetical protein
MAAVAEDILSSIRKKSPGDLKKGQSRNFSRPGLALSRDQMSAVVDSDSAPEAKPKARRDG